MIRNKPSLASSYVYQCSWLSIYMYHPRKIIRSSIQWYISCFKKLLESKTDIIFYYISDGNTLFWLVDWRVIITLFSHSVSAATSSGNKIHFCGCRCVDGKHYIYAHQFYRATLWVIADRQVTMTRKQCFAHESKRFVVREFGNNDPSGWYSIMWPSKPVTSCIISMIELY